MAKDLVVAVNWYSLAAEQGYADALGDLGNCYEYGNGTKMCLQEAIRLYSIASDQYEHVQSQVRY